MSRVFVALLSVASTLAGCHAGGSPEYLGEVACPECRVEMTSEWQSAPGNEDVNLTPSVLWAGRLVILADDLSDRLVVLDADGNTVRTVGRRGDGPGEFRGLSGLARLPSGDIVATGARSISLFDEDLSHIQTRSVPFQIPGRGVVPLDDTLLVVAARTFGEQGRVVHQQVISIDGTVVRSHDSDGEERNGTFLAAGSSRTVWSAPLLSTPGFRIERWNADTGERLLAVERTPPWYREWNSPENLSEGGRSLSRPDPPQVIDMYEASDGILWVITRIADDRWADAVAGEGYDRRFDSVVEALDCADGTLLAGARIDRFASGFSSQGHLVVYWEDDSGRPGLELRTLRLEGHGPGACAV